MEKTHCPLQLPKCCEFSARLAKRWPRTRMASPQIDILERVDQNVAIHLGLQICNLCFARQCE
jgi:hypothetical protein